MPPRFSGRRRRLLSAAALAAASGALPALAQGTYPDRPVMLLVPNP